MTRLQSRRILGGQKTVLSTELPFSTLNVSEVLSLQDPTWLVEGFFPEFGLMGLFGDSGVGKSFLALDLALRIATGKKWANKKTKQGGVIYIAAEGALGLKKRLRAWLDYHRLYQEAKAIPKHDIDSFPFWMIQGDFNLTEESHVERIQELVRNRSVSLVVLDTLNRVMQGTDEGSEAMNIAITSMQKLESAVLTIHHSGYENKGRARGHSSWHAGLDADFRLTRARKNRAIDLSCTKMKDAEEPEDLRLYLHSFKDSLVADTKLATRGTFEGEVLSAIQENPGCKHSELKEILKVGPNRLTNTLKQLEEHGFIRNMGAKMNHAWEIV